MRSILILIKKWLHFSKQKNWKFPISEKENTAPFKFLHYISFVEKVLPKPTKLSNVQEIYSIKNVQDAQISHSYTNKFYEKSIKTFLGFDSKFRCFQVYDFLKNQNESIFGIELIDNIDTNKLDIIKSNLFYLEVQSLFDSSILYSINYNESFNFYYKENEFSTFLSFNKQEDFLKAKESFKSLIKSSFIFNDIKLIDKNEYSLLFPSNLIDLNLNLNLFFIIFRVKYINKNISISNNDQTIISSFFKESVISVMDALCKLNDKYYKIVAFNDFQKRKVAYKSMKRSIHCVKLKSYYPEKFSKPIKNEKTNDEELNQPKNIKNYEPLFKPKEGLFYVYFREYEGSKINYSSNVVRTLFGIKNISDLQRNYYFQNNQTEYTFMGFQDKKIQQIVYNDTKMKNNALCSNIVNGEIFMFDNNNEEKTAKQNDNSKKLIHKNDQFHYHYVYQDANTNKTNDNNNNSNSNIDNYQEENIDTNIQTHVDNNINNLSLNTIHIIQEKSIDDDQVIAKAKNTDLENQTIVKAKNNDFQNNQDLQINDINKKK